MKKSTKTAGRSPTPLPASCAPSAGPCQSTKEAAWRVPRAAAGLVADEWLTRDGWLFDDVLFFNAGVPAYKLHVLSEPVVARLYTNARPAVAAVEIASASESGRCIMQELHLGDMARVIKRKTGVGAISLLVVAGVKDANEREVCFWPNADWCHMNEQPFLKWVKNESVPDPADGRRRVAFETDCCGEKHFIYCYHDGEIRYSHHSKEEMSAEAVLAAMGGQGNSCFEHTRRWEQITEMIKLHASARTGLEASQWD